MDGGATDHMTDRLEWFDSLKNVPEGRWPVMIADNRRLWVRGVGRIQVKCQLDGVWKQRHIHRVLYVPQLRKNLFSVGQAADKGFITTYTRHTCYVTSNEGRGKIVLTGTRVNKLYKLEMTVIRSVSHANIAAASVSMQEPVLRETPAKQLTLWHQRFGHAHHAMLVNMHANNTVHGMGLLSHTPPSAPCEGCALGKSARRPFPKQRSSPRAEGPGLFFHADVCGPMSHDSLGKARYFVLFKDDYSGYRFVYCIKQKSDVLGHFKALCTRVPQQTANRVKMLRSDRGGEFTGGEFTTFLVDSGIRHQLTSPHTPEQNGSAERENRTLVECVRMMLHTKKLSLSLWEERRFKPRRIYSTGSLLEHAATKLLMNFGLERYLPLPTCAFLGVLLTHMFLKSIDESWIQRVSKLYLLVTIPIRKHIVFGTPRDKSYL